LILYRDQRPVIGRALFFVCMMPAECGDWAIDTQPNAFIRSE